MVIGGLIGFCLGLYRDRMLNRQKRISDTVERYIEKAKEEPMYDQEAYRIASMVESGVALLADEKELEEFFSQVTGRGHPHPWRDASALRIIPNMKALELVRSLANEGRIFEDDQDLYDYLLEQIGKIEGWDEKDA